MTPYTAPLDDMRFALETVAGLDRVAQLPGCGEATPALVGQIFDEAGRFAHDVLSPLYASGDREGSRIENGVVRTPEGWGEAYRRFAEGGWAALPFDTEHGGQGLPWAVATPVAEMWNAANLAFALCPMLTAGAAEALAVHGSDWQKRIFLSRLVSGAWTGTMNLTEPQAGSDLGAIRTRAVPDGDRYRITGQKIYITYGEHEMAENIVHLVLARTPDAPPGVRGISLFVVPKFLPKPDGSPGQRNDLRVVSLERKLGIHASPTCVMAYGDGGGATGWLVGEENRGLEYMFTMMNNERLAVGMQGLAVAERAYQLARAYARERKQGRDTVSGEDRVPILRHPDVRRMLMTMRAQTEAMRALCYDVAAELDRARRHPDAAERAASQALVDFLTPVVKAWCTDLGVEVASMGVQIHGGMGYVEETGAAQVLRDARITPIYEGTNGIQARDLVGRKVLREGGETARRFAALVTATGEALEARGGDLAAIGTALRAAAKAVDGTTAWLLAAGRANPLDPLAAAAPYLRLIGVAAGGWMMGRSALAAANGEGGSDAFLDAKRKTAAFYAMHLLPEIAALSQMITAGSSAVMALPEDAF